MEFTAWEQSRKIEKNYLTALRKLRRFIIGLIGDSDTIEIISGKLTALASSDALGVWAQSLAQKMVTHTLEENAKTWRQAARMAGEGRKMYAAQQTSMRGNVGARTQEIIQNNAQYIKSVPQNVAVDLVKFTGTEAFADNRSAYEEKGFRDLVGKMTENHAKLISRTETAKAHAALNQAQSEDLGLDFYIWHSTRDVRTRDSHRHMNGVLCRYSDPPAPEELIGLPSAGHYSPGNIYNCRCFASSVILWRLVEWPHKVYASGSITTMGKREFFERFGGDINEL